MENNDSYWESFWKRRLSRRRVLQGAVIGGAGLATAAVIGCDEEEEGTTQQQQPGIGGQVAADQPRQGGTVVFVTQANEAAPTLDIHKIGHTTMFRAGAAYTKLVRHDLSKYPNEFAFIGEFAESWEIPNPTTYVFKLRRGVKLPNVAPVNGRELKAADVLYSYQRQIDEKVNAAVLAAVDKMEAVDDYTVRLTLKRPDADFIWSIQDPRSEIVPRETVEAAGGDLKNGPVIGAGPWSVLEYAHEQILKMKRNPNYFLTPLPYAEEYHNVVIPDLQTGQAAFRTGQVVNNRTNAQITRLLKQSVPDLKVESGKLLGAASGDRLWMSPQVGPTKDQRVRQALGMLFDRPAIIRDILFEAGWVTSGVFMPAADWHLPDAELNKWLAFDIAKAKQLFSAAGFDPNTWRPQLDYGIPLADSTTPNAELYSSTLKQVGIQATLRLVDKVEITDKIWLRADTEFCVCNKPTFSGTNGELYIFYHSTGRFAAPYKQLADKTLDDLIDKQAVTLNAAERKAILQDVQKRVLETAIAVPIYSRTNDEAIHPKLKGYKHDTQEVHRYAEVWLAA